MANHKASDNKLQLATQEKLDEVREKLQHHLPKSSMIHGALLAWKTYMGMGNITGSKIYYSQNSAMVAVTPAFTQGGLQSISIFWDIEKENDSDILSTLLSSIPGFKWNEPLFLYATPMDLVEKVQYLVSSGILGDGTLIPHKLFPCHYYAVHSLPDIDIRIPEGLELKPLSEVHAQHMQENWEYKFSETNDSYTSMVKLGIGFGVFKKSSIICNDHGTINYSEMQNKGTIDENDMPVAWTHINPFNVLTNTFTMPGFRGKQLAAAVTLAMVKKSLENTGIAAACIGEDNMTSIKLHEKLGFKKQFPIGYQYYKSSKEKCVVDNETPFA